MGIWSNVAACSEQLFDRRGLAGRRHAQQIMPSVLMASSRRVGG
jgi:hypothetical protein